MSQVVIVVVVWVAVVLNEHGLDFEGGFVFPLVVNECDEADALDP